MKDFLDKHKTKKILSVLLLALSVCLCACSGPREVSDFTYTARISGSELDGKFTGTILDKLPNGEGTFAYSDSTVTLSYTGTWEAGMPMGEGILEFDGYSIEYNGNAYTGIYSGATLNGVPHGNGSFTFSSEEGYLNYAGAWEEGFISGNGSLETNLYIINFSDGIVRQGEYKGETLNGKASGEGVFSAINADGNHYTYTGEFSNGTFNGYGTRRFDEDGFEIEEGNFENGAFLPTPSQFFKFVGTKENMEYELTENAASFLEKHPDVFVNTSTEDADVEYEENFRYEAFAKNPAKFGDKLIKVSGLNVVQIFEHSGFGYDYTFCIAQDSAYNVYYFYMLGYAEDVYEGDRITLTALPLDYFTYPNTMDQDIWAIACAAVSMG